MNKIKSNMVVASDNVNIAINKRIVRIADAFSMFIRILSLPFILLSKIWLVIGLFCGIVFYDAMHYDTYKIGYGIKAITEAVEGGKKSIEIIIFCIAGVTIICYIVVRRLIPGIFSFIDTFFSRISLNAKDSIRISKENVEMNDKLRRYGSLENYITASMEEFRQSSNYVSRGADNTDCSTQ